MPKSKSQQARELRRQDPSLTNAQIAKKLKIAQSTVVQAMKYKADELPQTKSELSLGANEGTALVRGSQVKTLEDLLKYLEVDQAVWEVERHLINKWQIGAKGPDGEIVVTPLFQVKAWLRRKVSQPIQDTFKALLEEFKTTAPKRPAFIRTQELRHRDDLLELSLFDLHFGKLCWAPEVGQSYDLKIALETLNTAVDDLLARASGSNIGRILLPVGNDFFNVDNKHNMTSAGTPQDCDSRWQKSFIKGRKAMVDVIDRLRSVAPVEIVMVSGNHDTERVFYLGEVLQAHFSKTPDVWVDNSPKLRKYVYWGNCLLGFTHGDKEKHDALPLIMATEEPMKWAATKYREFHVGHFHMLRNSFHRSVSENRSVRVRVIPSLCPPDAWHYAHGYDAQRAAEAFVWNKSRGCVATFSHQPSEPQHNPIINCKT